MKLSTMSLMASGAHAAHWAVIMAGSNTYGNYRHQADACHAYQIAKAKGIPESNIILLAYDDIANNSENPFPGKMFNKPDGADVYAGCKISYKGSDVTAANFLKVLQGDSTAPGPVLKSTAEDKVFVYYADHGGPGILGVPSGAGDYIHATDLNNALVALHDKGGYKELLFYLEACESGSIFANLLKAPNAKAVTAANPTESSWGYYCPPQDTVQGKSIGSCLGDEFSIHWMEDADVADFNSETIGQQVQNVTTLTQKSHVMQYGDSTLDSEVIGHFEGSVDGARGYAMGVTQDGGAVNSRDIEVHLAYYKVLRAKTAAERKMAEAALGALLLARAEVDAKFLRIAEIVAKGDRSKADELLEGPVTALEHAQCHKESLRAATEACGSFNDYALRYSRLFANMCNQGVAMDDIMGAVQQGCGAAATCTGSADPVAPACYTATAGALGVTETVSVSLTQYSAGAGQMDFVGTGVESITCKSKSFTKSGQDITVDVTDCVPSGVTVNSVKYCSDTDTIAVSVKVSGIPISTVGKKVACTGQVLV
jgi:legumain